MRERSREHGREQTREHTRAPEPRAAPLADSPALSGWLIVILAAAVLIAWAQSAPVDDLYVSLVGGHDVLLGRLARPDQWSYMTAGRVWIDQNWLSHLLIYAGWRAGGEYALLALKAALLAAMAALVYLLSRDRSRDRSIALLVTAILVLGCVRFVVLRPNLISLVLFPLALLVIQTSHAQTRRRLWLVPLACLWANAHGGFVLLLLVVGLWVACALFNALRRGGAPVARAAWPLTALFAACVLVCAVSPFGVTNLTHPVVIASSHAWRQVPEWLPLTSPRGLAFPWEFVWILGALALLGLTQWVRAGARKVPRARTPAAAPAEVSPALFEWLLVLLTTAMAIQSRRFVPIAVLACAAPLAAALAAISLRPRRVLLVGAASALSVACAVLAWRSFQPYRSDHPIRRGSTTFDRMFAVSDYFPVDAAEFLRRNHVAANVFSEWEWEGYLRWIDPHARVFLGSRAQQAYPESSLALVRRIQ
ncbi:MAG: hypothetical protein ACRENS_12565, partial [Candidatus Eiseniibacteriota bacterium]